MSADWDFITLAAAPVRGLDPYQPGKPIEQLERELGLSSEHIIKLASNENPLGPSPEALIAAQTTLPAVARYPDGNGFELRTALAKSLGVDYDQITLGYGSNDLLQMLALAYLGKGRTAAYARHAFIVYPTVTRIAGAAGVEVDVAEDDFAYQVEALAEAAGDANMLFIANPNNPTGAWLRRAELAALLDAVPASVIVVLDEAYFEYARSEPDYPDGLELIAAHPNLVVVRTFSKIHGLAGLRIGYAVSHPQIAQILNRVRQPFNVSSTSMRAAQAALEDGEHLERSLRVNQQGLRQLRHGLADLDMAVAPSLGNFLCFDSGLEQARALYDNLLQSGVIVRPLEAYALPRHLRVSVGLEEENRRFLDALRSARAASVNTK